MLGVHGCAVRSVYIHKRAYLHRRRMSGLSIYALEELVKGQDGELAVGKELVNPGQCPL